ncbi:MAG: nuclease domain-containing protein [Ghiorsea sp.]
MKHVYPKLRKSAQGQDCTLQIAGVCCGDPETTVLAHLPSNMSGMAKKSPDFCACFACFDCHNAIDGRTRGIEWLADKEWYMRRAQVRTLKIWIEEGLIEVKG